MSISIFLLWLVSTPLTIHAAPTIEAAPQPRGYLLNCGGDKEVKQDGVEYMPDIGFIAVGNTATLTSPKNLLPVLQTLRYFPNKASRRYCFSLPVIKGQKYLVKTIYYYGGFDGGKEPPVFDQIIDGTRWSVVNTTEDFAKGQSSYYEAIVTARSKYLSVCLGRNEFTVSSPFISALELEYVDDPVYNSTNFEKYALVSVARQVFGSAGEIIRFPDDKFNRFWHPMLDNNPVVISHSNITPSAFWNAPPQKAFSTGVTTSRGKTLIVKWPPFPLPSSHYYIALYFQDNRTPSPYSWRVFDVFVNGEKFYSELNVTTDGVTVYGAEWPLTGQTEISLVPRNDMPVGPVINAGELLQLMPIVGKTLTRDAMVMEDLKRNLENAPEDWVGDPCLPKEYTWIGVTCSYGQVIRIISLNLTDMGLRGSLPDSLSKLTALKYLWLKDNKFSGTIPDLSALKALESLHLENNLFSGSMPQLKELPNLHDINLQNIKLDGNIPDTLTKKNEVKLQVAVEDHEAE